MFSFDLDVCSRCGDYVDASDGLTCATSESPAMCCDCIMGPAVADDDSSDDEDCVMMVIDCVIETPKKRTKGNGEGDASEVKGTAEKNTKGNMEGDMSEDGAVTEFAVCARVEQYLTKGEWVALSQSAAAYREFFCLKQQPLRVTEKE